MDKILIAVPCMDSVATGFCSSLLSLELKQQVGNCGHAFYTSSLIYDSRNCLAIEALKANADYVLWLDSDMAFESDILDRLMKTLHDNDVDMVSGLYFRRVPPYSPVVFPHFIVNEGRGLASWVDFDGELKGVQEVDAVGFGCVLMKTEVLKKVHEKYDDFFSPIGRVGEDLSFCWRAKKCGFKLVVDCDVKLGHLGTVMITDDFYFDHLKEQEKEKDNDRLVCEIARKCAVPFDQWNSLTKEEQEESLCELKDKVLDELIEKLSTPGGKANLRECLYVDKHENYDASDKDNIIHVESIKVSLKFKMPKEGVIL